MLTSLTLLPLLTGLSAPALAADPVLDALEAELKRASEELELEGAERPYYVAYRLFDVHRVGMTAQLGGLIGYSDRPDRDLGVEVRVGSEAFTGETGPDGAIVHDVPADAEDGELTVWIDGQEHTWPLKSTSNAALIATIRSF